MLTVLYPALLATPSGETSRIVDFLGLRVGPEQRQRAIELVGQPGAGQILADATR